MEALSRRVHGQICSADGLHCFRNFVVNGYEVHDYIRGSRGATDDPARHADHMRQSSPSQFVQFKQDFVSCELEVISQY